MVTPDDIIEARRIANARAQAAAAAATTPTPTSPSSVRRAEEATAEPSAAATESPSLANRPGRPLTADERAAQLKLEREEKYRAAQVAAMGTKPVAPPADENFTYDYVWRQDVGGPGGKWVLVKTPIVGAGPKPTGKTVKSRVTNADGSTTITYSDGTTEIIKSDGTPEQPPRPTGVPPAFVYNPTSKTWTMPAYPNDGKQYTWDDASGWVDVNVIPGATGFSKTDGTKNLAVNTFKNTLALLFGPQEANQPWMDELYKVVSSYYKTGSTMEEATNLALRDARNNPNLTKFTKRFKAIFALEDMVRAGKPVYVPTISEYVATEEKLADVLNRANLKDLATQDILGDIIGTGKSVTETTSLITDAFGLIDNAPAAWKDAVTKRYPGATRAMLAKALLLGEKGSQQIQKEFQTIGVQTAAEQQGLTVSEQRAADIFAQGVGYTQALGKFSQVAKTLPRAQFLRQVSGGPMLTQLDVEQSIIEGLAAKQQELDILAQQEEARYAARAGTARTSLASQTRGMV